MFQNHHNEHFEIYQQGWGSKMKFEKGTEIFERIKYTWVCPAVTMKGGRKIKRSISDYIQCLQLATAVDSHCQSTLTEAM